MAKKGNRIQVILECTEHKESGLPGTSRYITTKNKKNNPYSLATLSYYLYFRELEISRVIEIIESIRYSLSSEDIITKILKLKARRSFA